MADANDPYQLARFVAAHERTFERALEELRRGRKQTHWMWFVFPQLAGLGTSETARRFAIRSRREAAAYLAHPVLGPRLVRSAEALLACPGGTARDILGSPDDLKLCSSMTLFQDVDGAPPVFEAVLERFFDGRPDLRTLELLDAED